MANIIVWFNVGFQNSQYSTWQTCIVDGEFSPESFRFQDCRWDDNGENPTTVWVTRDNLECKLPREVESAFDDLDLLLEKVELAHDLREDVGIGRASIHIYDVFDMDDLNEWGHGKALWDE